MVKLRWATFLVFNDNNDKKSQSAEGYRDDSLQHDDYKKGIHISIPEYLNITLDCKFQYGAHKMKAYHVQKCHYFKDHSYVFAKEEL